MENKSIPGKISGSFIMVNLEEINQDPLPYSMFQHFGRAATSKLSPRNCLWYLLATLVIGGGGDLGESVWEVL